MAVEGGGRGGLGFYRSGGVVSGVGAGGVWRRVVVCAVRRPVWVVHGFSVQFCSESGRGL